MAIINFGATVRAAEDPEKTDVELRCDFDGCTDPWLCDVEDDDNLLTLPTVVGSHYESHHAGEGNFETNDVGLDAYALTQRAYELHSEGCEVCCILGGEFCPIGAALQEAIDLLEA